MILSLPTRLLAVLVFATTLSFGTAATAADQVLITHVGVGVDKVSLNTTRLIFSMQLDKWPNGPPVRVFVLPDNNPVHRAFSKDLLSLYPRQLRRVWDRQLYSGTGQAPVTVASEAEMRRRVVETPGSIGYLSRGLIDETVNELAIR